MKRNLWVLILGFLMLAPMVRAEVVEPNEYGRRGRGRNMGYQGPMGDKLHVTFSFGEGAYINAKCGSGYDCDSVMVTPADFELLAGYKLNRWFALDLGLVMAVDFDYYDRVNYMTGLRPGVRFVFPLLFHRSIYLRAALPILFGVSADNDHQTVYIGLLLGIGVEWRFGPLGLFGELDFTPFFVEMYPGYYAIPIQGRIGVAMHF
ncbi:MAG: hypothetical protein JRF33_03525 [Deltaproteobacteria bacterium]|nr:hypothetical protein [Deltaproteobacteria bacterium]